MTLSTLAFKNLRRKKIRSLVVVLSAALACGLVFGSAAVLRSVGKSVELGMSRLGADLMVVPSGAEQKAGKVLLAGEPAGFYMDRDKLKGIQNTPGVEIASPQIFMVSGTLECCTSPNVLIVGYDPKSDFTLAPWVRGYSPVVEGYEKAPPVLLGARLAHLTNYDMFFYGKQLKIEAVLHETGVGLMDGGVFMTMEDAHDMVETSKTRSRMPLKVDPERDMSTVLVRVAPGFDVQQVATAIETSLPGVKAMKTKEFVTEVRNNAKSALWGIFAVGIVCWLTTLALLALVFVMMTSEREREMGMLRAMGASKGHVFRLIMTEALMQTGIGCLAGVAVAWAVIVNFKQMIIVFITDVPFLWPSPAYLGMIGVACIFIMSVSGAVAALYPALKVCNREPYHAIHQGM